MEMGRGRYKKWQRSKNEKMERIWKKMTKKGGAVVIGYKGAGPNERNNNTV